MPIKRIPYYEETLVGAEIERELSRPLPMYMRDLLRAVKATWPVDTGESLGGWTDGMTRKRNGNVVPYLENDVEYAQYVFRGGQAGVKNARMVKQRTQSGKVFRKQVAFGFVSGAANRKDGSLRQGRQPIVHTEHYDALKAVAQEFERYAESKTLDIVDAYVLGNLKRGMIGG